MKVSPQKITLLTPLLLLLVSFNINLKDRYEKPENQKRLQKIVSRDSKGRITKTFDGSIYRLFDTLGRQVEWYGNYNNDEGNANIHKFVEYRDNIIIAREYVLKDKNKNCKILDSLDCSLTKYYYKNGNLFKREDYMKITAANGKVTGHKLVYTDTLPKLNPYIFTIPGYLK